MRKDKELAFELRHQNKSYGEIARKLSIPTSTLSGWFKNQPWSIEIKNRLAQASLFSSPEKLKILAEANRNRWESKREKYRQDAIRQFPNIKDNPIILAGLMLYWGEGDKVIKNSRVKLSNSDPQMLRVFRLFLRHLEVPENKIRIWLLLYPDLIDSVQKKFWGRAIGVQAEQFRKSIFIKGGHATRRLSYGVGNVEVYSRELKEKIIKWLEMYQDYLLRI